MEKDKSCEKKAKLEGFRTLLPQVSCEFSTEIYEIFQLKICKFALIKVISTVVTAFLLLDVGASNFYSTIIIPALTGLNTKNNPDEFLRMTAAEASWFGM